MWLLVIAYLTMSGWTETDITYPDYFSCTNERDNGHWMSNVNVYCKPK